MREICTKEEFLAAVFSHGLTIVTDVGLNRHLKFRRPGTNCYGFDIVTWDGYLAYTGDMGCFVFSRIPDMLQFFRSDKKDGDWLQINKAYWAEKLEAVDRCDGYEKYSPDRFREVILERLDSDEEATDELRRAVADQVLSVSEDGAQRAYDAASNFQWEGRSYFQDFWEYGMTEYTYRYIFCCYALVWGIRAYDTMKEQQYAPST